MESQFCSEPRCDHCDQGRALLYCRADSAKLCFACDRQVHSANALFARHTRSRLCDSCAESPASIFCSGEASVLCHDCDWESHRHLSLSPSPSHRRRPLEGFSGCPSASEFLGILGFQDFDEKALLGDGFGSDVDDCGGFLVWDVVPCDDDDDAFVGSDSARSFQAMGVPPLPKNRNSVCGRHKDEVIRQIRELARTEPNSNDVSLGEMPVLGFGAGVPGRNAEPASNVDGFRCEVEEEANVFRQCEDLPSQWFSVVQQDLLQPRINVEEAYRDTDKHSDVGDCGSFANADHVEQSQNPADSKASLAHQKVAPYELSSQERETAISRYKEKRKTRRFDKRIRYESRKVRAEGRTRIKGRFAKIEHGNTEM